MQTQPTSLFGGGKSVIKQVTPLPTASLLAYYDAGLTASYSASGQQTWFDLSGNNYHLTATGSLPIGFITSSQYSYYPGLPCFGFSSNFFHRTSSDLCDAFNPTASGYQSYKDNLCTTGSGPLYFDNIDYTILVFESCTGPNGGLLNIGEKVRMAQNSGFPDNMFVESKHERTNPQGSVSSSITQQLNTSHGTDGTWALSVWSKSCAGLDGSDAITQNQGYTFYSPYSNPTSGVANAGYAPVPTIMKAANNLLTGSGVTRIGTNVGVGTWSGEVQAVAIYNKVLTYNQLVDAANYFLFRKL